MKTSPFPIKSTRSGGEVRAAASSSERVALPSIYPALTRLTEAAIEGLFSEAEVRESFLGAKGSDNRARLTKQEEA